MAKDPGKEELIREAAVHVFSRKGFHKARAEEIAEEAGVAVGTIYNYFKSKADILLSIFKEEFEDQMRFYEELQKSALPVPEQIRRILQAHFSLLNERQELAKVLVQERFNWSGELGEKLADLYRGMLGRIEALVREGVEEGWVRSCNPRITALALFAIVESISTCGIIYPEEEGPGILQTAPAELACLIWDGLKKGESA
jgi:TetR/AcrR family fatty acid metabolism transcriptional regulator